MYDFLNIELEEISGKPKIAIFTMTTNISSVQTRLSSVWEEDDTVHKISNPVKLLEARSLAHPSLPKLTITGDGRVSYQSPKCPFCGSTDLKRNGLQKRKLKSSFNTTLSLELQKYQCHRCHRTFKVDLNHIVPKYGHYAYDVKDEAIGFSGGRALSLKESADLTKQVLGVRPSREAIRLWKLREGSRIREKMNDPAICWSGVYSYDEQYVKIKGKRWYRCLIFDVVHRKTVSDLVVPDLKEDTLRSFLIESLSGKRVLTIITDGSTKYPDLLKLLFPHASHQICVVHTMYNAKKDFNEAAGISRNSDKPLPVELRGLYGELWSVFLHSNSVKDAEERFLTIYKRRFEYPVIVRRRIESIAEKFVQLTEYLEYDDVPMTNNCAERFFQMTYPGRIKKKFKTPEGLQAQISCLDASKGGWSRKEDGGAHETLQRIYQTFAQVIATI